MAGGVVVLANEGGGATEEGIGTSGNNDTFSFTLFTSGAPELRHE